jgi:hypothetical protein
MSRTSFSLLLICLTVGPPAAAQAGFSAPVAGETVQGFEMVEDRTVIFEPAGGGKVKIISVENDNPAAPAPRNPGQVSVAMNYALETGTLLEFNNGLGYAFDYEAVLVGPSGAADAMKSEDVCPVRKDSVGSESWPQPYRRILISGFRRNDGAAAC